MELHRTLYFFIIGNFNAKVEKKSVGMTALGKLRIDIRNDRGDSDMLVDM